MGLSWLVLLLATATLIAKEKRPDGCQPPHTEALLSPYLAICGVKPQILAGTDLCGLGVFATQALHAVCVHTAK